VEFSSVALPTYRDLECVKYEHISEVLETYYAEKNQVTKMRQKSGELRHIVATAIERTAKKLDLQLKQLKDTEKRERYKVYGELLNVYGYDVALGATSITALNYYTNEEIEIPLDAQLSPTENAKKYFARYNKLKRTYEALSTLTQETAAELAHLKSIQTSLDMALQENDLMQIREELAEYGYIKRRSKSKKERNAKSKPLHFISSDGFHMYVGKNNFQNDELTFKVANTGDWWFHANDIPGSHVIVKKEQADELPDATFEEAARLAAYYSSGRTDSKVEVDYTKRGNLKKPAGAKPGFVIYHTNYSIIAIPDITGIEQVEG
jgi:predicted ribosome quality control (RQC) complex YloA/Tae2 family protein